MLMRCKQVILGELLEMVKSDLVGTKVPVVPVPQVPVQCSRADNYNATADARLFLTL